MKTYISFSLALSLAAAACGASSRDDDDDTVPDAGDLTSDATPTPDAAPPGPSCTTIGAGFGGFSFTRDEGATIAPVTTPLSGTVYTEGLVAVDSHHFLAGSGGALWASIDGGCTWQNIGTTAGTDMRLVAGGNVAYGFGMNTTQVYRIDFAESGITVTQLHEPGGTVFAAAVDPADPLHVRLVTEPGQIVESTDGGASRWSAVGGTFGQGGSGLVYSAAFDPADWDHVVVGVISEGYWTTKNAGTDWTLATGLAATGGTNGFNVAISGVDGNVVWAEGLNLDEANPRHVFRSTDGGLTFTAVVDDTAETNLFNGNPLFPHPTDANVLYYTFGSGFQNYGSDLYRYDAADQSLSSHHTQASHRLDAITFVPGAPEIMLLGLSHEQID